MQGFPFNDPHFSEEEVEHAMSYLRERLQLVEEGMQPFLLRQYSNSNYKL
jgi:hypothetical protein